MECQNCSERVAPFSWCIHFNWIIKEKWVEVEGCNINRELPPLESKND